MSARAVSATRIGLTKDGWPDPLLSESILGTTVQCFFARCGQVFICGVEPDGRAVGLINCWRCVVHERIVVVLSLIHI